MSKKERNVEAIEEQNVETGAVETGADVVEKSEKFKEMKREAAKRFKEKRAAERNAMFEHGKKLYEVLKDKPEFNELDEETRKWLESLANPQAAGGFNNVSVFSKLFGDTPSVGQSITLIDAMTKTLKGKADLNKLTKKWAEEKGIIVTFNANADDIFQSTYVIEKL